MLDWTVVQFLIQQFQKGVSIIEMKVFFFFFNCSFELGFQMGRIVLEKVI